MRTLNVSAAILAGTLLSSPAFADTQPYEAGTILLRLRAVEIAPDVSSHVNIGGKVSITDAIIPEADITYFLSEHFAVEAIAGTDKHSIYYNGSTKLGSAFLLPPTVTLQYNFDQIGPLLPYVGAGPNYTFFYDKSHGALGKLHLTDGFGFALQIGTDIPLGDSGAFLNVDVKRLFLSTTSVFDGAPPTVAAHVNINPWLIGAGVGIRL